MFFMEKFSKTEYPSDKNRRDNIESFTREYFPEKDKEMIRAGLRKLAAYLESLTPKELPEIVLFPDTSARPLSYAVRPLIREVYRKKGAEEPHTAFMISRSAAPFDSANYFEDMMYGDEWREEWKKSLEEDKEYIDPDKYEKYKDAKSLERIDKARDLIVERAREIKEKFRLGDNAKILIVDDYSRVERTTFRELARALHAVSPGVEITAFTFLSGIRMWEPEEGEPKRERMLGNEVEGIKEIVIGMTDPLCKQYGNPPIYYTPGFRYRAPDDPIFGGSKWAEVGIGVKKDEESVHVTKSPEAESRRMRELRSDMTMVGREIAAELR